MQSKIQRVLLFLNVILVLSFHAQASEKWTRDLSMQYMSVPQTALSPDGKTAAWVVRSAVMEGEKSEYSSHIRISGADGRDAFQYTRGEHSCTSPSFSPCGTYLAFLTARSGKQQIWAMRVQGGEAFQITEASEGVGQYQWSPCGSRLAYTMTEPDCEDEKRRKKEKMDVFFEEDDLKNSSLYTVEFYADKDKPFHPRRVTDGSFHAASFDFSPDGRTLVFAHQESSSPNIGFYGDTYISSVPSDSGEVKPIVTWEGGDYTPIHSPDGKWIAFASDGGKPEQVGLRDLYIIPSSGGEPKRLALTPDRNVQILGWSGDSRAIFIMESFKTQRHIFSVPVNGKEPSQISSGDGVTGSVSFDKSGRNMVHTFQMSEKPVEVYYSSVSRFRPVQISRIHDSVPMPAMGKTELLCWKSKDGMEIEGLLTYPVDYEPGRKVPLILEIHGGPAGVYSETFTGAGSVYMLQYFARHGYAILRPNPRGSTGYGKEFRYANVKDWGFGDYEDIMSGVDHVIEMGVAHEDSLCVTGWSYGGYLTSFAITRTNRFKAASMGAGLPNLISMVTTTDISNYLVAHFGAEIWEDYRLFEKHSAMYRVANVTTPTQIIHGQNDLRVPYTQGLELFRALRRMGVPAEMVSYPRTAHYPNEPKLMRDAAYRILAWFEKQMRGREMEEAAF